MTATLHAAPASDPWSEVRAHDHVTRYRRTGSGRAVVVLAPLDDGAALSAAPLWPELAVRLAGRFRILVPEVPASADLAPWLAAFLEGIGTSPVALVAAGALCMPALELSLRDPDQVARLVLVPAGGADTAGDAPGTASLVMPARTLPLLVAPRALAAADALRLIEQFLDAGRVADSERAAIA